MNGAIFQAARDAGCTRAEAEVLAWYVEVDTLREAAYRIGISEGNAQNHASRAKRRLNAPHLAAAIHRLHEAIRAQVPLAS